ncbi:SDR family oxidoreductase [Antrihabitans sp. YC2-6]|uniref:SDR family oxidoreductase n=1 Tax=Antrihabitans sp. YC2-6 TaxID=2799498 RepID=UPI0018F2C46C|nr:SDR family oxidoreductase [Antrihabitans sp. YC2-6]MBJ8345240.1 SDR family oxidoreductase [Antrihabitans sp. YC2-6]
MKSVAGKRVLITGAAMGMGKLYAQRAVQEGAAAVVLWDINETALNETAAELADSGCKIKAYVVDVSDRVQIEKAAAQVRADVGDPHVVVNNAGIVRGNAYFWETDSARDTEMTMKINSLAPMFIAREFLPGMIASDEQARLINISSAAGLTANPRMASYCGSKWAAVGWSDSVRLELEQAGHSHVKVTTVCPYYINTGMFEGAKAAPLLPILEPETVVDEVWKEMKKGAAFVVLPKTVLLSEVFKGILPTSLRDFVAGRVLGVYKTMEDFTGRK